MSQTTRRSRFLEITSGFVVPPGQLSKTGRMELMARMTGRIPPPAYRVPTLFHVTPGFNPMRDKAPYAYRVLGEIMGLEEAAGLRERSPEADIPDEVRGGFLIPPVYIESLLPPPEEMDYVKALEVERKFKEKYQGKPKCDPIIINGFSVQPIENLFQDLSPKEEALLREAPVFRLSPIEPQPDVVVNSPKENQC